MKVSTIRMSMIIPKYDPKSIGDPLASLFGKNPI